MDTTEMRPNWLMRYLDKHFTTSQFTAKQIIDLYIPMVLDQFSIYVIGILANSMVSASSQEAISATSLVGSLAFMVVALFSAMATGGTVLVAQAKGRGDADEIRKVCGQVISIAALISIVATVILVGLADPIVRLFFGKTDPLIIEYGITYLRLYGLSFVPFAIYLAVTACFRGMGNARQCLVLTIIINVVHLICSFIFINIMDMGVAGVGLSFIVARVIGAAAAIVILFWINNTAHVQLRDLFHIRFDFVKKLLHLAFPFALEQMLFNGGALMTSTYVATLPTASIAANSIATSLQSLFFTTAFAMQNLVMTVCGQCIGAKNYELAKHYVNKIIKFGRILIFGNAAIVYPLLPLLMLLYQPSALAEPVVYQLLLIGIGAWVLLWSDAYLVPACLRAAGDATFTTVVCLCAMWIARVVCGYVMTITLGWGIHAVWITFYIEYLIRIVIFHKRFKGTKWIKM